MGNDVVLRPVVVVPLGDDRVLLFADRVGTAVVNTDIARALLRFSRVRSLDRHVAEIAKSGALGEERLGDLRDEVKRLLRLGFFLKVGNIRPPPVPSAPPLIKTLAVVTKDRAAIADESTRSYVENALQAGHDISVLVCDDSGQPKSARATREMSRAIQRRFGVPTRYMGRRERDDYCCSLAKEAGVPVEVAVTALLGSRSGWCTRGANTNSLFLDMLDEPVLVFDDDTFCDPARRPEDPPAQGASDLLPFRFHPFTDQESLLRVVPRGSFDFLGAHQQWLGKNVGELVSQGRLSLEGSDGRMVVSAADGTGHVPLTWSGLYGDSGSANSCHYLSFTGPARGLYERDS